MKIVTYNINGIRASCKLGLLDWIDDFDADVYCFQEVRCSEKMTMEILGQKNQQLDMFSGEQEVGLCDKFCIVTNCGKIAGYAGTMTLCKRKPDKVFYDMGEIWADDEGRTTTIVFGKLAIVNAYIPNGGSRLEFKMKYLEALSRFLEVLKKQYYVVCVGDFNIAHNEIDLTNPKECKSKSVFLPIERKAFGDLLDLGLVDCFRFVNPEKVEYSWRSYRSRWDNSYQSWKYRIDYVLASQEIKGCVKACEILDLPYSDHLPCVAEIDEVFQNG